ncbi:lymphocyte antigen 6H-like [Petaurus breviceps papuanus]|uniref:lymphocyte antigen 6H-like n=1 Tax=Petaurus breviceps papuanus TaxID=3040969 RepID=UPI0036DE8435
MPRTMWVLLPVLLSTLLCVQPAHGLHCYQCSGAKKFSQCQSVQCSPFATRCASLEATDKDGPKDKKLHFKDCSNSSCVNVFEKLWKQANDEVPASVMDVRYTCCSKELCNSADGIRGMNLIGALLLSLGPVFLWAIL